MVSSASLSSRAVFLLASRRDSRTPLRLLKVRFVHSRHVVGCLLTLERTDVSPFAALSADHLMSKVSSLRPVLLDPDVLSTPVELQLLSACLWTTDYDVELIPSWAARWTGMAYILSSLSASIHDRRPHLSPRDNQRGTVLH